MTNLDSLLEDVRTQVGLTEAEAKVKTDPKLKGKKVTGTGFRPSFKKGLKGVLTGQFKWAQAGRGYEYEVKVANGETDWFDTGAFEL